MRIDLLRKVFGARQWHGRCTVIIDAPASIHSTGPDSLSSGGQKVYAPRLSSGRVEADSAMLLPDDGVLLLVEVIRTKLSTGEERVTQSVCFLDTDHIVGVEFPDLSWLELLEVDPPAVRQRGEYGPNSLVG